MTPPAAGESSTRRGGLCIALAGPAISFAALATYFTVVPRWPALRDAGHANVALGIAGALLSFAGWRRSRKAGGRSWPGAIAFSIGATATAFLAVYIYHLSYQLPPARGVIEVGAMAPAFRLRDQEGRERALEDLQGRRVVLVFFRGHW